MRRRIGGAAKVPRVSLAHLPPGLPPNPRGFTALSRRLRSARRSATQSRSAVTPVARVLTDSSPCPALSAAGPLALAASHAQLGVPSAAADRSFLRRQLRGR